MSRVVRRESLFNKCISVSLFTFTGFRVRSRQRYHTSIPKMDLLKGVIGIESKTPSSPVAPLLAVKKAFDSTDVHFEDMEPIPFTTAFSLFKKMMDTREDALAENPTFYHDEVKEDDNTHKLTPDLAQKIRLTFPLASMAYEEKMDIIPKLENMNQRMVFHEPSIVGNLCTPGYYMSYDSEAKTVFICIKGTSSVDDMITDALIEPGETTALAMKGLVHSGIAIAAEHIVSSVRKLLMDLFVPLDYSIVFTGHSLGAGTAALASMMLSESSGGKYSLPSGTHVSAVTFGSPPITNEALAEIAKHERHGNVISVVNRYDFITRGSLRNVKAMWAALDKMSKLDSKAMDDLMDGLAEGNDRLMRQCRDEMTKQEITLGGHDMFVAGHVVYLYERHHAAVSEKSMPEPATEVAENESLETDMTEKPSCQEVTENESLETDMTEKPSCQEVAENESLETDMTGKPSCPVTLPTPQDGYGAVLTDGKFPALQRFEIDLRSFYDHRCGAYAKAIAATLTHKSAEQINLGED